MADDSRDGRLPDEVGGVQTQSGRQIFETLERSRKAGFDAMGAALAHELNQPLAALTLYLQSLSRRLERDPSADPMLREFAGKASSEAQRAGEIVRRMRRLSLRAEPELQAIDLNALARECTEAALAASTRHADIRQQLDPDLPPVLADPVQIRQVILNLLRNAAEATARVRAPVIELSTEGRRDSVRLSVADNGPGIGAHMAAKLFRAFETSKPDGMGLGLAISRMIAQNHGGDLVLERAEERPGARFELRLPVRPMHPRP
jgi:two-component system sensor kinase FixL